MTEKTWRCLAIGDVHMSNRLPLARPSENGRTDRLDDQLSMWGQIRAYAEANLDIEALIIGGDLFDKALLDAVTLTETVRALRAFTIPIYIVPGNHDASSLRGGRFTVEVFSAMAQEGFHVLDALPLTSPMEHGPVMPRPWLALWTLPYMPIEESRVALAIMQEAKASHDGVNVLLMHNSVMGCKHLGWKCDDGLAPDEVTDGWDYTISGHFHTAQKFGNNSTGFYMGAPMQFNIGDAGETRGFWDLTFEENGDRTAQLIPVEAPRFMLVEGVDAVPDALIEARVGDYLRIVVDATHADWVMQKPRVQAVKQELIAGGFRADYRHRPIYHHESRINVAAASTGKRTMDELVADYVDTTGVVLGSLDADRLKRVGRALLSAARSVEK